MGIVTEKTLKKLGGNKFIAATGSNKLISIDNTLNMMLKPNRSKAKYLDVTLRSLDTYDLTFYTLSSKKIKTIKIEVRGINSNQLQASFTEITGLYTTLKIMDDKKNCTELYLEVLDQKCFNFDDPITNSKGQKIEFYEDSDLGDATFVIAVCHDLKMAAFTDFFDTQDFGEDSDYNPVFLDGKMYSEYQITV